jgi:hypothetical protein
MKSLPFNSLLPLELEVLELPPAPELPFVPLVVPYGDGFGCD